MSLGIIWPWERKKVERELDSVENMLESMFKPVAARPSFTSDLRKRLVGKPGPLAKAGLGTLEFILLAGGALLGMVVFIFTVVRSMLAFFTGRKERRKKKPDSKPAAQIHGQAKKRTA